MGVWLTVWNNNRISNIELREKKVIQEEDYWSTSMVMFRYNSMKLQVANLKEKLEEKETDYNEILGVLLVEEISGEYREDLITKLANYIEFMQNLCDANDLIYPDLVLED